MKIFLKYGLVLIVGFGVGYGYCEYVRGEDISNLLSKISGRDKLIESYQKESALHEKGNKLNKNLVDALKKRNKELTNQVKLAGGVSENQNKMITVQKTQIKAQDKLISILKKKISSLKK